MSVRVGAGDLQWPLGMSHGPLERFVKASPVLCLYYIIADITTYSWATDYWIMITEHAYTKSLQNI